MGVGVLFLKEMPRVHPQRSDFNELRVTSLEKKNTLVLSLGLSSGSVINCVPLGRSPDLSGP